MCRYRYSDGKCAHPKNISLDCVGEEGCVFKEEEKNSESLENSALNLEEEEKDSCTKTQCGIYCKKYNRFYCAGEENCDSEEEYLQHMNQYGGIDIGQGNDDQIKMD